ncbi:MAG: monovalent cation/H+ antiporter complex subunit F [Anaerolineae bacterium]|jgi:multicomponent Na+:H+ antiporter subunit F|nr:monovalent cation/H+ antiporter complex subunit F [Anaerolineae bacterium]
MVADSVVQIGVTLALIAMVLLLPLCAYLVLRGPQPADRLQALDAMTTIFIGVIVVVVILVDNETVFDLGIALAAFSFIATLAIARYISEGRVF